MNHLFRALPSMDASLDALLAADKALHSFVFRRPSPADPAMSAHGPLFFI